MVKKDTLILRINKLQEKMNIRFDDAANFNDIYSNNRLLIYKYVTLLHLEDLNKANHFIDHNLGKDLSLDDATREALENKREELASEEDKYKLIYSQKAQYKNIACMPIDSAFEKYMLNHKRDLDDIFDVNAESVHEFSDSINKGVFHLDEENEEVELSDNEIERRNIEAIENKLVPDMDLESMHMEKENELRDRLTDYEVNRGELTPDEEEVIIEVEEMINEKFYDQAERCINSLFSSSECDAVISEETITDEEVNEAYDEDARDMDEVLANISEEAFEEAKEEAEEEENDPLTLV